MLAIDLDALPPDSSCALVARSSSAPPEFVLADRRDARFIAARWRRHKVYLAEPARLGDHLLSYCARGGVYSTVVLDGVATRAQQQAGSITFLPAGRSARWLLEAPVEMLHVHCYISPDAMRDEVRARLGPRSQQPLRALMNIRDPWLDGFFRLLVAEYEACRDDDSLGGMDFLDRMGSLLVRHLVALQSGRLTEPHTTLPHVSPLRPFILRRIEAFVEKNLASEIRLEHLASMASMSIDHFVRSFKQATGSTPHRYLLERRLDRACALLNDSTDGIADIARRCGFAGAAHFSATFHAHHGMTPTQYRRRT
jgi:AraC family transcriptional regulator